MIDTNAAMYAVDRGWKLVPARVTIGVDGKKHPIFLAKWATESSNDEATVAAWWKRYPDATVAVLTKANDLVVIDLDLHDEHANGLDSWERLVGEYGGGEIPETFTVRTPSGGLHYYFRNTDERLKNSASDLGPGIDVRGAGAKAGGVVFFGRMADGREYVVENAAPVAELPEWLKARMLAEEPEGGDVASTPWTEEQAAIEIERTLDGLRASQNGSRNNQLNSASFRLARFVAGGHLTREAATELLELVGIEIGLDADEVRKTVASGLHSPAAKAQPMSRASGKVVVMPTGPKRPMPVARALERGFLVEGVQGLRHWRGDWLNYEDGRYRTLPQQELQNALYMHLEHAVYKYKKDGVEVSVPWNPTSTSVREVMSAQKAIHALGEDIEPGTWLDGEGAQGLIAVANGLLNPVTRTLEPHTARYFSHHVLPFDFDGQAECPAWLDFLGTVFGTDEESKELLQEWFGYVVSGRTDIEKMMFFKGASRSGKGVTSRVLGQLLGAGAVAGPTLSQFGSNFGMASLIGKPLAVIDDARSSMKIDMQAVIERFLTVTGRGRIDIDRKNRDIWTGVLPTRLMMLSNELPWFRDASGAITGRMLMLVFPNSFLGKEDRTLDARLSNELPGILNWALSGLDRLSSHGGFTEPEGVAEAALELAEQVSPVLGFIRECCTTGKGLEVRTDVLYAAYQRWAEDMDGGRAAETRFGMQLVNAPGTSITKKKNALTDETGKRRSLYLGITLGS